MSHKQRQVLLINSFDFEWRHLDHCHIVRIIYVCKCIITTHFRGRRSIQDDVLLDQIDDFDDLNAFFVSMGETNDKDRYNRDNGLVAIRQICTGFKNWSKRYLGKCSGQRVNQHQVSVTLKVTVKLTLTRADYSDGPVDGQIESSL